MVGGVIDLGFQEVRRRDVVCEVATVNGVRPHILEHPSRPANNRSRKRNHEPQRQHWQESAYRGDDDFVFCHPTKGTALDPSKLSKVYLRPALQKAGITKPFRPFHDLRHTALTHDAAAGNPAGPRPNEGRSLTSGNHRTVYPRITGDVPRCRAKGRRSPLRHEPLRESCRLQSLRGWSHVKYIEEVFAGGS